jgi:PTS system ascorbate-specific IIA component
MKNTLLTEKTIKTKIEARDWEAAVDNVGQLMVDTGLVETSYVEAMKRTIRELGPYSVIAPGIAMPHARPEDGVIKPGFALITLSKPVNFGSSANDPVDIVIAFAATDKEKHIAALADIANLLSNEKLVKKIRDSDSKEQILQVI